MSGTVQYYPFSDQDLDWFYSLLVEIADHPTHIVDAGWQKNGLELELFFVAKGSSEARLGEQVCLDLTEKVRRRTGVASTVVYNALRPHTAAQAAIDSVGARKTFTVVE